jgi:hypothetical protein
MTLRNICITLFFRLLSSCAKSQDPRNVWILRLRFAARRMTEGVLQGSPMSIRHCGARNAVWLNPRNTPLAGLFRPTLAVKDGGLGVGWVELAKPNVFVVGWMLGFASLIPTYGLRGCPRRQGFDPRQA